MKFENFPYRRINIEELKKEFYQQIDIINTGNSAESTRDAVNEIQQLQNEIETQSNLSDIRHSIDTRDEFYSQENAFWDENNPIISEWISDYYQAVLGSPYRDELDSLLPATFFKIAEQDIQVFDPSIIGELQTENKLSSEYSKLFASAEIEYQGQTYNISGLTPFTESPDREVRKEVNELISQFFTENQSEFDRIYDELVKVRDKMAKKLGFTDFVEMGYARMNRLDYDRKDVEGYREAVSKYVVPLAQEIYDQQAKRLNIEELKYYDLGIEFESGNAVPAGNTEELVKKAGQMYHELSPETGEFIDFMTEHDLLDLETKAGKRSGGYCTYIPNYYSPFIFSNFNGTSGDVDVLTHEAGHALQVYESRGIQAPEVLWPTMEGAEIHSMSMEFFTWPWMDLFFGGQTAKYKYSHLSEAITFLPYGVLVDHFQHEVYENPAMSPEERRATWRKLEAHYLPWKDYDGNEFYEAGGYWFRQLHIFTSPFYYIDYTLAQVCALQFWQRSQVEQDDSAWPDYMAICRVGGTKSFLEIVELAHLKSPFDDLVLEEVTENVRHYLANVDAEALK